MYVCFHMYFTRTVLIFVCIYFTGTVCIKTCIYACMHMFTGNPCKYSCTYIYICICVCIYTITNFCAFVNFLYWLGNSNSILKLDFEPQPSAGSSAGKPPDSRSSHLKSFSFILIKKVTLIELLKMIFVMTVNFI